MKTNMTKANVLATIERRIEGLHWSIGYWDALVWYHRTGSEAHDEVKLNNAMANKRHAISDATAVKSLILAIGAEYDQTALDERRDRARAYWLDIYAETPPYYTEDETT